MQSSKLTPEKRGHISHPEPRGNLRSTDASDTLVTRYVAIYSRSVARAAYVESHIGRFGACGKAGDCVQQRVKLGTIISLPGAAARRHKPRRMYERQV